MSKIAATNTNLKLPLLLKPASPGWRSQVKILRVSGNFKLVLVATFGHRDLSFCHERLLIKRAFRNNLKNNKKRASFFCVFNNTPLSGGGSNAQPCILLRAEQQPLAKSKELELLSNKRI